MGDLRQLLERELSRLEYVGGVIEAYHGSVYDYASSHNQEKGIYNTGGSGAHNNMTPYQAVNI